MADDDHGSTPAASAAKAGLDIKGMVSKLEAYEFKVVADLFNLVNNDPEKETELVDLFARYYEKVSHSQEFLCWAIEWEVQKTEHPSTLFRLESVATGLLFRHFFSDDGMYCLETSVCPLIERVSADVAKQAAAAPSSSTPGNANAPVELAKDVDYVLKQTKMFLQELEHSCSLFPLDIREAFRTLHARVHDRFPETKNALAVVLFLRFLCPTILQPASFGITEEPLGMDVVKTLLPIARLLQCIANESVENKIFDSHHNEKIFGFIRDHVDTVRAFCTHLTNEQEISVIKKMTKMPEFRPDEKDIAMQNIIEYITGPEFPMPSLELSNSARTLPALVKKRKVYTLEENSTKFETVLDYVKINVVFLFSDLEHPSYITMMDESAKIRAELDKLGVKQILLAGGNVKTANLFFDNCKFKGDVLVDTSGKMGQLFSLQKRKSTKANLYMGKMAKLRKKFAVNADSSDGLAWVANQSQSSDTASASSLASTSSSPSRQPSSSVSTETGSPDKRALLERRTSMGNPTAASPASLKAFREMQLAKAEKSQKELAKEEKKKEEKEKAEPKLVKMFVLFGDRISFESKYEGQPQDLLNLLQACGARPEVIETARKRLKKRKKLSIFGIRRNSVKTFASSLKEAAKEKEKEKSKDKDKEKNKDKDKEKEKDQDSSD